MHMMSVSKIRILRLMYSNIRKDGIRIKGICNKVEVALIENKLGEGWLRWFVHMQDKPRKSSVWMSDLIYIEEMQKGRERPKNTWSSRETLISQHLLERVTLNQMARGNGFI